MLFQKPLPARPVRLVGLTGGIGTGKSTAAAFFRKAGATVVDADLLARWVVEPGSPALDEIHEAFGETVFRSDGSLDRDALGDRVFADAQARARLNAIVHPRVQLLAAREIEQALAASTNALVVYDVPLLFETGIDRQVDIVVVVYAPRDLQQRRLRKRGGLGAEEIRARLESQEDIEEKVRRADIVLDNRGTRGALRRQVTELVEKLLEWNHAFLH